MSVAITVPHGVDVLIADDDPLVRTGVRQFLERAGYRCCEAEEGLQAVELARRQRPACVLLDLAMPVLDGLSVARLLRADPQTHGLHINCLTGLSAGSTREQASLAGCEAFLTKPINPPDLLAVVRRQVPRPEGQELAGLSRTQAEGLLDWLETWGCTGLEVCLTGEAVFTVRWHWPPDRALDREAVRALVEGL